MLNIWDIEYYVENSSQSPVFKFIEQLSPSSKAKIINSIDLHRIEQGTRLPSLSFLKRLADALHMNLEITLI